MKTKREQLEKSVRRMRDDFRKSIAREIEKNPRSTHQQIGKKFGISAARVSQIATEQGIRRPRGTGSPSSTRWKGAKSR